MVASTNRRRQDAVTEETPSAEAAPKVALRPAGEASLGVESPARRLQLEIAQTWEAEDRRWTARRTMAFVVVSNVILWAAIVAGVRAIL